MSRFFTHRTLPLTGLAALVLALSATAALAGVSPTSLLLKRGEQPGFTPGKVHVFPTPAAYRKLYAKGAATTDATAEAAQLKKAGFDGGAAELLHGHDGDQAYSVVDLMKTPAGAKQIQRFLLRQAIADSRGGITRVSRFSIPGVTGRGMTGVTGLHFAASAIVNYYWTSGRCLLGSGLSLHNESKLTPAQVDASVITGVKAQLSRVQAACD